MMALNVVLGIGGSIELNQVVKKVIDPSIPLMPIFILNFF